MNGKLYADHWKNINVYAIYQNKKICNYHLTNAEL